MLEALLSHHLFRRLSVSYLSCLPCLPTTSATIKYNWREGRARGVKTYHLQDISICLRQGSAFFPFADLLFHSQKNNHICTGDRGEASLIMKGQGEFPQDITKHTYYS